MKSAVLAFVLIITVVSAELYTAEQLTKMKVHTKECRESTHADHEKILRMREGHFEEDQHIKDYLFCFFKKIGWQHEDGTVDKEKVKENMSKSEVASEAMRPCLDNHGDNGSETAYAVYKCYKQRLPAGFRSVA